MKTLTAKLSVLILMLISTSLWAQIPLTFNTTHNAYEVGTLDDLVWLSDNNTEWDEHYVQVADIDATATGVDGSAYWNNGDGFKPIGDASVEFTGHFSNAGSFTISNLYINRLINYVGLFGLITNANLSEIHTSKMEYKPIMQIDDLENNIDFPGGEQLRLGWVIWHVIEHEIHHRGELSLILGLLGHEGLDV